MAHPKGAVPAPDETGQHDSGATLADAAPSDSTLLDRAWAVILAAGRLAGDAEASGRHAAFALSSDGSLTAAEPGDPDVSVAWRPGAGWEAAATDDEARALFDLYLPIASATRRSPTIVAHLGQSLDGFIATNGGESQWVTGHENIQHLHRMRALADAVVVGAGTVAFDNPQLTTRRVDGPNPLRVVLDPTRRLAEHYRVFRDGAAETLYVCGRSLLRAGETHFGRAALVGVKDCGGTFDIGELVALLQDRGCARIFVEGGGVTVSRFLEASLLDRLHVAIAPLIIGNGRPAIRLQPPLALGDCQRPGYRVFRMGGDVLFDCELRANGPGGGEGPVTRVI